MRPTDEREVDRLVRQIERLNDGQIVELHRALARMANPIYKRLYPGHWETGMANSRAKWERATAKRQDVA